MINKNNDFFEDFEDAIDQLSDYNREALDDVLNIQTMAYNLFQHESTRLSYDLGTADPRIKKLNENTKGNLNLIRGLRLERELSEIDIPEVPKDGMLVHGRISDKTDRGIAGLSVFAENEKGNTLRVFGNAETNASGYFAIQIEEGNLIKLRETDTFLTIANNQRKIIHREKKSISFVQNDKVLVNISLDREPFSKVTKPKTPTKKATVREAGTTEKGKENPIDGSANKHISKKKIDDKEVKRGGPKIANE